MNDAPETPDSSDSSDSSIVPEAQDRADRLGGDSSGTSGGAPGRAAGPAPGAGDAAVADKYDQMLALGELFDSSGNDLRSRARLGTSILTDDDVAASAELSPGTWAEAEDDIRAATTGKHGLLTRSVELDADALVVRATVLTYRWIDELQQAAYRTIGSIAGRAIGYLAPEVALGGAIVSAGLIETDAMDRDGITSYLNELAENNPELMDHMSDGGGLLDGLHLRSVLTAGVLASDQGAAAARGGLRAIGVAPFATDAIAALRDAAGGLADHLADPPGHPAAGSASDTASGLTAPRTLEELMGHLVAADRETSVQRVGSGRYIAYLPGDHRPGEGRLRLVGSDTTPYVRRVVAAIEATVTEPGSRVMLVGSASGGAVAAEVAATVRSERFEVDQVVTAGAPSAQVPDVPERTRVLSLEDRADPVALLGSLMNVAATNRLTVVFDGEGSSGAAAYVAGGRAADRASHAELREEIQRIHGLGFLAG